MATMQYWMMIPADTVTITTPTKPVPRRRSGAISSRLKPADTTAIPAAATASAAHTPTPTLSSA